MLSLPLYLPSPLPAFPKHSLSRLPYWHLSRLGVTSWLHKLIPFKNGRICLFLTYCASYGGLVAIGFYLDSSAILGSPPLASRFLVSPSPFVGLFELRLSVATLSSGIVPAQLGFLLYTIQAWAPQMRPLTTRLLYYASVESGRGAQRRRHRSKTGRLTEVVSQEERNERLRQIGLAQGMVEFSKSFSGDTPVDTIETEKSRVVLHELEPGWWILAVSKPSGLFASHTDNLPHAKVHRFNASTFTSKQKQRLFFYRDPDDCPRSGARPVARGRGKCGSILPERVKPSPLLLQDLLRAHSIFLLHHDSSLSALLVRSQRTKFSSFLAGTGISSYQPGTCFFMATRSGMSSVVSKLLFVAELGMGVGEEERGER